MEPINQDIYFESLLSELAKSGNNNSEKGTLFENFCFQILKTSPLFVDDVNEIWTWKDFPGNGGNHDIGIDLVVLDKTGKFWAIQCKFYNCEGHVSKADVDSFLAASYRPFEFNGEIHKFDSRMIFSTTDSISENVEAEQNGTSTIFGPKDIKECGIDWSHFDLSDVEGMRVAPKKILKPHQEEAVKDVLEGFKAHDRGKLIMACGTGKTFTSLKIVEKYILENNIRNANILYLVPSIALLSQTILEWGTQVSTPCDKFGICSDSTAGKFSKKKTADDIASYMPIPATTDVTRIVETFERVKNDGRIHFFFSTYQSIDVIQAAQKALGIVFDMAICDEAHRTIGAYEKTEIDNISNFSKINDGGYIIAKKRLYMTATEKIYTTNAKKEADDKGWEVYSMDDEKVYGPTFHYLSFGQAVSKQLLTDYKLIVMDIRKSAILKLHLPEKAFDNLDDAAKIIGSLSALSKKASGNCPDEFIEDPEPMKRAVAFCQTINSADRTAATFTALDKPNVLGEEYLKGNNFVDPEAKLITGKNNASEKEKLLNWLRGDADSDRCKILTNARCLSEGVDVPALDAVIFMARKRSQVDIIQAVGRVMRKFGSGSSKRFGYIIIPVVINDEKLTDKTLSNNEDYKVVWQVVQALRSHDERLDTEINKIEYTGNLPHCICQIDSFIPPRNTVNMPTQSDSTGKFEGDDTDQVYTTRKISLPSPEELRKNDELFGAHLVKHCGNRLYWEDWSKNIGDVTNNVALKIKEQVTTVPKSINEFKRFKKGLTTLLNPSITDEDCINMLAEHLVTLPIIEAIFNQKDFASQNPITKIMSSMLKKLSNFDKEIQGLQPFYDSVQKTVKDIDKSEGRQDLIKKLFEKFFKYALPSSAEKFGIVYTPIEIVDFIINSVSDVLKNEFHENLSDPNVKIFDPFTGTGTFIVRLLEKLKRDGATSDQLEYKYKNDIWCNEIMLMAYYIALINIEDTHGRLNGTFEPFSHAVLTDTFQMAERRSTKEYQGHLFEDEDFAQATRQASAEDKANIRIIISNPPYSVGQKDLNDNNANDQYPLIDSRIQSSYASNTNGKLVKGLYDSYVRAFRWASDRINENGIISFVSNGSYVDNLAFSGFRRELLKEFNHVYVYNLRGNCRSSGEFRKKEAGNVFGEGSRTLICIITLVKHKGKPFDGYVHYKDIGDYLTREQKLQMVADAKSITNLSWENIYPDKNNDWLNKKNEEFEKFINIGDKNNPSNSFFADNYSVGLLSGRDSWVYSFSSSQLKINFDILANTYEENLKLCKTRWRNKNNTIGKKKIFENSINYDSTKIKWTPGLLGDLVSEKELNRAYKIKKSIYRPFEKKI